MKVLEIKNNLVKIAYDVKDNLALSSFVVLEDENSPYVAQVMNIKADTTSNFAIVKLLFTFDKEGVLKNYNGTIPSLKANITVLPSNELLDIIPVDVPIAMGNLAQQNVRLKVDKSILENNLLVCSDNFENTEILLNNIIKQIKDKVVIFDTDGQFDWDRKLVFGKDFRLPLNYDTINFIYDTELDDVDATSKAIIQDIFIEVQEYIRTLPENYLPFETFVDVVDQQYRETKITQLILLKNKLLKYKELNVFAETLKDIMNLSIAIEKTDLVVIDISDMTPVLQKAVMTYVYSVMKSIKENIYSFVKINNTNITKKLLKTFIEKNNIFTTIICPHEFKYIMQAKEVAQNMILFTPLTLQHDFAGYNTFLNKLNKEEFVIYGAHTQNIPLIVELDEIDDFEEEEGKKEEEEDDEKDEQNVVPMPDSVKDDDFEDDEISLDEETAVEDDIQEDVIEDSPSLPEVEYPDITIDEAPQTPRNDSIQIVEEPVAEKSEPEPETVSEPVIQEEPSIEEPVIDEDIEEPEISIDEEPEIDYSVADSDVEEDYQEPQMPDLKVEEAQPDRTYYEEIPSDNTATLDDLDGLGDTSDDVKVDELTDDDLNLIDDLTSSSSLNEEPELDSLDEEDKTPVVPIYPADDIEQSGEEFEAGDKVSTKKYGEGIVEKMIKYGNKMLCSIEFPNIGRRLLDPSMTEITKLS